MCSLGMCPDRELNPQTFSYGRTLQPLEPQFCVPAYIWGKLEEYFQVARALVSSLGDAPQDSTGSTYVVEGLETMWEHRLGFLHEICA